MRVIFQRIHKIQNHPIQKPKAAATPSAWNGMFETFCCKHRPSWHFLFTTFCLRQKCYKQNCTRQKCCSSTPRLREHDNFVRERVCNRKSVLWNILELILFQTLFNIENPIDGLFDILLCAISYLFSSNVFL